MARSSVVSSTVERERRRRGPPARRAAPRRTGCCRPCRAGRRRRARRAARRRRTPRSRPICEAAASGASSQPETMANGVVHGRRAAGLGERGGVALPDTGREPAWREAAEQVGHGDSLTASVYPAQAGSPGTAAQLRPVPAATRLETALWSYNRIMINVTETAAEKITELLAEERKRAPACACSCRAAAAPGSSTA